MPPCDQLHSSRSRTPRQIRYCFCSLRLALVASAPDGPRLPRCTAVSERAGSARRGIRAPIGHGLGRAEDGDVRNTTTTSLRGTGRRHAEWSRFRFFIKSADILAHGGHFLLRQIGHPRQRRTTVTAPRPHTSTATCAAAAVGLRGDQRCRRDAASSAPAPPTHGPSAAPWHAHDTQCAPLLPPAQGRSLPPPGVAPGRPAARWRKSRQSYYPATLLAPARSASLRRAAHRTQDHRPYATEHLSSPGEQHGVHVVGHCCWGRPDPAEINKVSCLPFGLSARAPPSAGSGRFARRVSCWTASIPKVRQKAQRRKSCARETIDGPQASFCEPGSTVDRAEADGDRDGQGAMRYQGRCDSPAGRAPRPAHRPDRSGRRPVKQTARQGAFPRSATSRRPVEATRARHWSASQAVRKGEQYDCQLGHCQRGSSPHRSRGPQAARSPHLPPQGPQVRLHGRRPRRGLVLAHLPLHHVGRHSRLAGQAVLRLIGQPPHRASRSSRMLAFHDAWCRRHPAPTAHLPGVPSACSATPSTSRLAPRGPLAATLRSRQQLPARIHAGPLPHPVAPPPQSDPLPGPGPPAAEAGGAFRWPTAPCAAGVRPRLGG